MADEAKEHVWARAVVNDEEHTTIWIDPGPPFSPFPLTVSDATELRTQLAACLPKVEARVHRTEIESTHEYQDGGIVLGGIVRKFDEAGRLVSSKKVVSGKVVFSKGRMRRAAAQRLCAGAGIALN